jgi:two-component system chemotaxis sensor kinase CheA
VQIVVADDGNGLNIEKIRARAIDKKLISPEEADTGKIIQVIFEPGFSTSEKATSISGRGVGMDIVRTNIDKLQGDIAITTESGRGTAFTLTVPLTLMITDGILVSIGGVTYVLTLNLVQECLLFDNCIRDGFVQHDAINYHGRTFPIVDLNQYICGTHVPVSGDTRAILTSIEGNEIAIVAERIAGKQQVVIKPFSTNLEQIPVVSGATILADGSVALILNMSELVKRRIPAFCDF